MLFILASTWLNVWFLLPWSATQSLGFGVTHHVFGDYITQNVLMSYFVAYAAIKVSRNQTHIQNLIWSSFAVLGLLSITHLSQGRTGFLLVAIALAAVLIVRVKIKYLLLLAPVLLAVLVAILSSSDILRGRFDQAFEEFAQRDSNNFSSIGHRAYNYKITPQLIAQRPVIGHGTGSYHTEICKVLDMPEWCPTYSWHPHNQFLFFGADHGLVGMVVYLALILSLFLLAFQARNSSAGMQLTAFTSILFADSLINSPLWSSRESQFFCFLMALLVCMCNQIRQQKSHDVKAVSQIV
jgi:O-antigen ligase